MQLLCKRCETWKNDDNFYNDKNNTKFNGKQSICKECNKIAKRKFRENDKNFIRVLLEGCKDSTRRRKNKGRKECAVFELDEEFILNLKESQQNRCILSGQELIWKSNSGWKKASIDRIDNDKGYIKTNVRLVCWGVNQAMSNFSDSIFFEMCESVYKHSISG